MYGIESTADIVFTVILCLAMVITVVISLLFLKLDLDRNEEKEIDKLR